VRRSTTRRRSRWVRVRVLWRTRGRSRWSGQPRSAPAHRTRRARC
jgi:hypothetical protein